MLTANETTAGQLPVTLPARQQILPT